MGSGGSKNDGLIHFHNKGPNPAFFEVDYHTMGIVMPLNAMEGKNDTCYVIVCPLDGGGTIQMAKKSNGGRKPSAADSTFSAQQFDPKQSSRPVRWVVYNDAKKKAGQVTVVFNAGSRLEKKGPLCVAREVDATPYTFAQKKEAKEANLYGSVEPDMLNELTLVVPPGETVLVAEGVIKGHYIYCNMVKFDRKDDTAATKAESEAGSLDGDYAARGGKKKRKEQSEASD